VGDPRRTPLGRSIQKKPNGPSIVISTDPTLQSDITLAIITAGRPARGVANSPAVSR
jgi:hypothetical protein